MAKGLGLNPPLGVRLKHVHMIGLLASMGLTVALFVSDIAFTDTKLQVRLVLNTRILENGKSGAAMDAQGQYLSTTYSLPPCKLSSVLALADRSLLANTHFQGDAKIGALLSGFVGVVAYGISTVFDLSHENVAEEAEAQLDEEVSRTSKHITFGF